jgi:hypothetical protein
MLRTRSKSPSTLAVLLFGLSQMAAQNSFPQSDPSSQFDSTGQATIDGRSVSYLVRHLPPSSFSQLPLPILDKLTSRGCLVPQTYAAHQPENVVHASLERPGSSDWAVLCSVSGTVSLLVFLSSGNGDPVALATAQETARLQSHGGSDVFGFSWAIDAATPEQVHQAQISMRNLPPRPDHDALADSTVEHATIYHYFSEKGWIVISTQD